MISPTERQTDALTELVNIAFGLTAAKLSEISGQRVLLEAPTLSIGSMDDLAAELSLFVTGQVTTVHQIFTGQVAGEAVLFLNYEGAVRLSNLLVEEHIRSQGFDTSTEEILIEVGNMLLSACLGVFGNLLQVHITFSIPRLQLDSLTHFLKSTTIEGNGLQYAMLITASFNILNQAVNGRIVLVLGISSLERLIEAAEQWEDRQTSG
jgi:chemotaxis protein CheC